MSRLASWFTISKVGAQPLAGIWEIPLAVAHDVGVFEVEPRERGLVNC